jgi:hypothetical protein
MGAPMWRRVARLGCIDMGVSVQAMAFKIETAARGRLSIFILSGHIETDATAELKRLFGLHTDCRDIVVDLRDVSMVDREVMRFLMRCESDGVTLENCTPYIREWMKRERDCE